MIFFKNFFYYYVKMFSYSNLNFKKEKWEYQFDWEDYFIELMKMKPWQQNVNEVEYYIKNGPDEEYVNRLKMRFVKMTKIL